MHAGALGSSGYSEPFLLTSPDRACLRKGSLHPPHSFKLHSLGEMTQVSKSQSADFFLPLPGLGFLLLE